MNLIEKYGSYDAAKAKQQELSKIAADPQLLLVGKIIKEIGEIEKALLEYRRQHNIFEVGDKVKAKDHQFGFDELFRIDDFFANDDGVNLAVLDDGDCYPISFLEHATDKEIKAGKRLEVK